MEAMVFALCIVGALLTTLSRAIGWRRVLGYATVIDVVATVLIMVTFSGSTAGLAAGAAAGLILSVILTAGQYIFGYDRVKMTMHGPMTVRTPSKLVVKMRGMVPSFKFTPREKVQRKPCAARAKFYSTMQGSL